MTGSLEGIFYPSSSNAPDLLAFAESAAAGGAGDPTEGGCPGLGARAEGDAGGKGPTAATAGVSFGVQGLIRAFQPCRPLAGPLISHGRSSVGPPCTGQPQRLPQKHFREMRLLSNGKLLQPSN